MGLKLFSCCTGGSYQDVRLPENAPVEKRDGNFTRSFPEANASTPELLSVKLSNLVQELLVRLPQVTGATWISRLESSVSLVSSLTDVDAVSITLAIPAEADATALPDASIVCCGGPCGSLLQQYQQQGYRAAVAAAVRGGDSPFTSMHLILGGVPGDVLLLSSDTSPPGPGSSTLTSALSAVGLAASAYGNSGQGAAELPADWATVASASRLRHFCGLPLRVGSQLVAVLTLAWASTCPVPPGLRTRCTAGATAAGAATLGGSGADASAAVGASSGRPQCGAAGSGAAGSASQPAAEVERTCLLQLARVFSLGLFGDASNVVFGQKLARMIQVMTLAATLQATLDGLLAGMRDILLHRCQHELCATLALKHTSAPTAAFILEGRCPPLLSPPPAGPLQPRGSTATGHVASPPVGHPASAPSQLRTAHAGGCSTGASGGGGGHQQRSLLVAQPRGASMASVAAASSSAGGTMSSQTPLPSRAVQLQGQAAAAAVAGSAAATVVSSSVGATGTATGLGPGAGAAAALPAAGVSAPGLALAHASGANSNPPCQLSGSHVNPNTPGSVPSATAGRVSISSYYRRLRSADSRGGPAGAGAGVGGGGGGPAGPSGSGGASGILRHTMSVDLPGSMEMDYEVPSTVHAHVTSLAHTLLMASLSMPPRADAAAGAAGSARCVFHSAASDRDPMAAAAAKRDVGGYMSLPGRLTGRGAGPPASGSSLAPGHGGGVLAGVAPGTVTPQGCVVPNCHLHVQDESLPCRDVVLVQKLLRMPVQSLVLVVVRPSDVPATVLLHSLQQQQQQHGGSPPQDPAAGMEAASHLLTATSITSLGLYLTSPDSLARSALQSILVEAREAMQLATGALFQQVTQGPLLDEWTGLLEAMTSTTYHGRMSYGSTRMVSLLRPRSFNMLQEQASGDLLPDSFVNSPSRGHLGTSPGILSSEMSRLQHGSGRLVVDASVEQPLQQLDAMVSSIQSTLSAVQLQLDVPGGGSDLQEVRLNDIAAVELMEIIGRGGQGVVFRGVVHGIEAAVKVISHRDETEPDGSAVAASASNPAPGPGGGGGGGDGSTRPRTTASALESPMVVDEARMRERKRNLLRDALELAVTITISHPNIVQMYGYFTDCVVVQYANQSNRLKLLPADSEALQQYGSQRGPVNTVMCMEFCDAGTLKSVAEAGAFRLPGVSAKSGPACPALVPLYTSLLEVALALRHLHARRLAHCDLKPSNVLLKSSLRDPRGWICKLSDFGCVRVLNEESEDGRLGFRQPQPLGTLTHMAPEMFVRGGLLDTAVDIYAFGVIMWELIMVAPLYDGTVPKEKLPAMIRRGLRPVFHPLVPPEYRMLATACWQEDTRRRPTAAVLVSMLQRLLVRAQAAATSTSSNFSGGPTAKAKAMSSSFSGVGPGPSAASGLSSQDPDAGGGVAGSVQQQGHLYGNVPRRNTFALNLGLGGGSHGGGSAGGGSASGASGGGGGGAGGGGQRQAFPPPVPSPLSREAGSAARSAVRLGDGSGGGGAKSAARLGESQAGSASTAAALSPLSAGLGPLPAAAAAAHGGAALPAAAAAATAAAAAGLASPDADAAARRKEPAGAAATAAVTGNATSGGGDATDVVGETSGAATADIAAAAAGPSHELRPSSLLGLGISAAGYSGSFVAARGGRGGSSGGAAATTEGTDSLALTPTAAGVSAGSAGGGNAAASPAGASSEGDAHLRSNLFPLETLTRLSTSTTNAPSTTEFIGL